MNTASRNVLIATAAWLAACGSALGDDKPSVGRRIGGFLRQADRRIQKELDRRPEVRKGITRGIDVFADNIIDAVEPEADDDTRRFARNGVQMFLNPSRTESNRAFGNMHNMIADRVGGNRGSNSSHRGRAGWSGSRSSSVSGNARGTTLRRSSSGSGVTLPPAIFAMGQADWHRQLWVRADEGMLAVSHSVSRFLPRAHARLTVALAETGLSSNAASTLVTVAMGLGGLFGLYLILFFPRRRLKRQVRQLRRQLEHEWAPGVPTGSAG